MRIIYVYPGNGSDVRSQKTLNTLKGLDNEITFIGWLRSFESEPYEIPGVNYYFHCSNTGFGGINVLKGLPKFWLFIHRIIRRLKPDVVIVVNEENGLLEAIFKKRNIMYVCDIHDSIADRLNNGKIVEQLASLVQLIVSKRFEKLIFTDDVRKKRANKYFEKSYVIYNAPFFEDVHVKDRQYPRSIYLNGTLNSERGIMQLIKAVNNIRNDGYDINILVAGLINDKEIEKLIQQTEYIEFVGMVSHKDSLNIMANSLATLAYYAPEIINNIYASPNKVYECMMTQTPVLTNSECVVAKFVEDRKIGLSAPYYDVNKLQENIMQIYNRDFVTNDNRQLFKESFAWDNATRIYQDIFTTVKKVG